MDNQLRGTFDFVQVFAKDGANLERLAVKAAKSVTDNGLLWVSYTKKSPAESSDLSRSVLWEPMAPTGLRPVAQVSIDETWSALRFRPASQVRSNKG